MERDIVDRLREISVSVPNVDTPAAEYVRLMNENGEAAEAANFLQYLRTQLRNLKEHLLTIGAKAQKAEKEIARLQRIMLDDTERERWIVEWDQTQLIPHVRSTRDPKPRTEWELICIVDEEPQAIRVCQIAHELLTRREIQKEDEDRDGT